MNNNKLTNNDVDKILAKYGFVRLGDYVNIATPFKCEKDGYWFNVRLGNIKKGQNVSKFGITNPFLEHNFRVALKKRGATAQYVEHKIVTKKHKKKILVTLRCECGKLFVKDGCQIEKANINLICPNCYKLHKSKIHMKSPAIIKKCFIDKGYNIVSEPYYYNGAKSLWLIEDKMGYIGYLSYNKLIRGSELSIYAPNNFQLRIYNLNNFFKNNNCKSKAIKMVDREHVQIICECGTIFECLYYCCFSKNRMFCPKCNKRVSSFERKVEIFLEEINVKFKKQFIINSCKDILPLPFDFYLSDYNTLIEVDGQQHFEAIECFGGREALLQTQKHDKIKTEYCKKWDIPLLRIGFDEILDETYKDKITKFIHLT